MAEIDRGCSEPSNALSDIREVFEEGHVCCPGIVMLVSESSYLWHPNKPIPPSVAASRRRDLPTEISRVL